MKDLSLHLLDLAQNSLAAGAAHLCIVLAETEKTLTLSLRDDGRGMEEAALRLAADPFFTTRTTRPVGLGLPLFFLAAEQTGGRAVITSCTEPEKHGTEVTALFYKSHPDCIPLGDMPATVSLLVQGAPGTDICFCHTFGPKGKVTLDTERMRESLGPDIPLNRPEILRWIRESLREEYRALGYSS